MGRTSHEGKVAQRRKEFEDQIIAYIGEHILPVMTKDIALKFGYTERAMSVRLDDLEKEGLVKKPYRTANTWSLT